LRGLSIPRCRCLAWLMTRTDTVRSVRFVVYLWASCVCVGVLRSFPLLNDSWVRSGFPLAFGGVIYTLFISSLYGHCSALPTAFIVWLFIYLPWSRSFFTVAYSIQAAMVTYYRCSSIRGTEHHRNYPPYTANPSTYSDLQSSLRHLVLLLLLCCTIHLVRARLALHTATDNPRPHPGFGTRNMDIPIRCTTVLR